MRAVGLWLVLPVPLSSLVQCRANRRVQAVVFLVCSTSTVGPYRSPDLLLLPRSHRLLRGPRPLHRRRGLFFQRRRSSAGVLGGHGLGPEAVPGFLMARAEVQKSLWVFNDQV